MRLLRSLHAWAGLVLALLVAVIALSGVLLVFKHDYLRAVFPAARQAAATDAVALGAVVEAAALEFAGDARSVVFGTGRMGLHQVYLNDGGGAYLDGAGKVVARWPTNARPEIWLFDLHQKLLGGETGHVVAGTIGLLVVVMTVTGFVVWLPGARAFGGRLWPRSTQRSALLSQHRDLGVMAAVPIVLLSLTGAAMVFSDEAKAVLSFVLPDEAETTTTSAATASATVVEGEGWTAALAQAQAQFPLATLRIVAFANGKESVTIRLRQPSEWHPNGRTRVVLSTSQHEVLEAHDAAQESLASRVYNALYPLHASRIGGRPYQAVVAGTGVALVLLSTIGGYSFAALKWRRARRRFAGTARPAPRVAATGAREP